jgi:nucleoside-diphosphate-sugar epimerase
MGKVLVTGATGFIGRSVCAALNARGMSVRAMVRPGAQVDGAAELAEVPDIARVDRWGPLLEQVRCIVHLASLAHLGTESLQRAREINVEAAARLMEAAGTARVSRLIHVSSAKVHGEETTGAPFCERSPLAPGDPYAVLKAEAESRLVEIAGRCGVQLLTVRPPLVYGPGVKANFLALMRAIDRGLPLPLSSIENRRSLIYVENLADAIARCVDVPLPAAKAYLVSDGDRLSTPDLCRALGAALGRPARLFPFPRPLLELVPALRRLARSFEVDDSAIRRELGWRPPFTSAEGIRATAEWYLKEGRRSRG